MKDFRVPVATPWITELEIQAVCEAVRSGYVSRGPAVEAFESAFAKRIGVRYAVAVASGTAAIEVALRCLDLQGREVLTTPHSCAASVLGILHAEAKPRFADVLRADGNLNPEQVEARLTPATAAILAVHCYGRACQIERLREIALKRGILLIEDCAMSLGAERNGRPLGTFGMVACFSFYGNKVITSGEGGVIATNEKSIAERARKIRNYGQEMGRPFHHVEYGYNFKMSNLHAALGAAQLTRLDEIFSRRRLNALRIQELLQAIPNIELLSAGPEQESAYFCIPLMTADRRCRDEICVRLAEAGVETRVLFPSLHQQPFFRRYYETNNESFPVAEELAEKGFYVGCFPSLNEQDLQYLASSIRSAIASAMSCA